MSNLERGMTDQKMLAHDRLAERFDALINPYDSRRRLEVLLDDFLSGVPVAGRLVLDAGCGTGRGTARLSERGARVVAFDLGGNLVRHTRDRAACLPVVGSILQLPFASGTFDIVYSSEVIEHTPDPLAVLPELHRVLKPGGHLVLSTPNWLWQWPVRFASLVGARPYDGLENFVRSSDVRRTLEAAGARVLEHRGIHLLPFQVAALHPLIRRLDRFGRALLPLMVNQCVHSIKPA